jgi:hypothetical protein
MPQEEFSKRTIDLDDGLDPLLPATHPHIGAYSPIVQSLQASRSNTSLCLDQSPVGAAKRCYFHLPDEAEELMKGRFRIIKLFPLSYARLLLNSC